MDRQQFKMRDEQKKHFLLTGFYALAIIALLLFLCNYAMTTLLPFVIAWAAAAMLHPLFGLLKRKVRFSCKWIGIALTLIFYLLIAFLGIILCDRLLDAAVSFLTAVPRLWSETLMPFLQASGEKITELFAHFNVEMNVSFNELIASAGKTIISYSTQLLGKVGNVAISIPGLLVDTIICIVSTIFILLDWEMIRDFIYRQLPQKTTKVISHASHQLGRTLRQYILSYLKDEDRAYVDVMLRFSNRLLQAYALKEAFYRFMAAPNRTEADSRLDFWLDACERLKLPEFNACRKMLVNWRPYILNAFDVPLSNGFTEGCNNAIKSLKRACFGFSNFFRSRKRILLSFS